MSSANAKRINRADLLRALQKGKDELLPVTAELCGFKAPKPKIRLKIPSVSLDAALQEASDSSAPEKDGTREKKPSPTHFYRVIDRKQSELLPEPVDGRKKYPAFLEDVARLEPENIVALPVTPPEKEPLVAWAKLWPVLRGLLSEYTQTRQPDIPAIVRTVANGYWLERIPRKQRLRWTANVQILVDRPERTRLFNHDYNQLLASLKHLRGQTGLVIYQLLRQPGGRVRVESSRQYEVRDWQMPDADTKIFILSDLGLLDESGIAQRAWIKLGQRLRAAGCDPLALLPLPTRYLTPELVSLFDCVSWDRSSSLQKTTYVVPQESPKASVFEQDSAMAEDLLAWLSPAVRVEPALLRAVRHQLPVQDADVGKEITAWHHDDVERTNLGFHFQSQPRIVEKYRKRFVELRDKYPELAVNIARLILDYHRHEFPTQRYEELLLLAALLGKNVPASPQEIAEAEQHMRELVKAGWEQAEELPGIQSFLLHQIERQHLDLVGKHDFYQAVWGYKQYELGEPDGSEIPKGFDPGNVLAFVNRAVGDRRDYVLFQKGQQALQLGTKQGFQAADEYGFSSGSALAHFTTASSLMFRQHHKADGEIVKTILPLNDKETLPFPLEEQETQRLDVAGESITLERFQKPKWADRISYSHKEMISVVSGGVTYYWYEPTIVSKLVATRNEESGKIGKPEPKSFSYPGFWYPAPDNGLASMKPAWAKSIERDWIGLSAEVEIAGIPQRFRWIEPTAFMMGSPDGKGGQAEEKGRSSSETQHEVILTQGYWLAEITCTQALWQAVMGENPSNFKGDNNPVENVSWNDITEKFLLRLNKQYPELNLRLPSEAEWENACRAGTTGAFNFEGELSLDKVNYRGTWDDYNNWGEGALHKTTEVKSYPPNQWGLYEMHGNVLEWCQDWYGDYPAETVVDPEGSVTGSERVLRGGSWIDLGRDCRSALRGANVPSIGSDYYGFRLARGHELSPVRSVRAGQQPTGSHAAVARGGPAGDGQRGAGRRKKK